MGTSAGTCAVSRLPIHDGDPVVVVTLRESVKLHMYCEDGGIGTYHVLSALSHLFMYDYMTLEERRGQDFYAEKVAIYTDPKRINHRTNQPFTEAEIKERIGEAIQDKLDSIQRFAADVVITRGKYNEYSYVVDEQGKKIWDWVTQHEQKNVFFIVHAAIWDQLTASATNEHKTLWKTVTVQPEHMHVERVYVFVDKCYNARIELIDHCELFPSDGRAEYWEARQAIEAAVAPVVTAKYNHMLENGWFHNGDEK